MLQTMLRGAQEYFTRPLSETSFFYPKGRRAEVRGAECAFCPLEEAQPAGLPWEFLSADAISPRLGYVQTGCRQGTSFVRELLVFLGTGSGCKLVSALRVPGERYRGLPARSGEDGLYQEVGRILLDYGRAVYTLDAERALGVFAPEARMIHPTDGGGFADVPCTVFRERWAGLPGPEEQALEEFTRIYRIELLDERTAVAKVGVAKLADCYNDYLFCRKIGGEWKIIHKLTQLLGRMEAQ